MNIAPDLSPVPDNTFRDFLAGNQTLATTCGLSFDDLTLIAATGADMLAKGQTNLAWEVYEGLTVVAPDWYGGYAGMGAIALQRRKLEYAAAFLQKAVSLYSSDPAVLVNLGEALLRLAQPVAARESLGKALRILTASGDPLLPHAQALYDAIQ